MRGQINVFNGEIIKNIPKLSKTQIVWAPVRIYVASNHLNQPVCRGLDQRCGG